MRHFHAKHGFTVSRAPLRVSMKSWPQIQRLALRIHNDARGSLHEVWRADELVVKLGFEAHSVPSLAQATFSSSRQNVLRGLHYQATHAQGKLLQVIAGTIWDVAVDMRLHSPTLGQWQANTLDGNAPELLWIPPGFAHGFYVLEGPAQLLYYATKIWQPDDEFCIAWNDPTLAIPWPLAAAQPVLSARDAQGLAFTEAPRHA